MNLNDIDSELSIRLAKKTFHSSERSMNNIKKHHLTSLNHRFHPFSHDFTSCIQLLFVTHRWPSLGRLVFRLPCQLFAALAPQLGLLVEAPVDLACLQARGREAGESTATCGSFHTENLWETSGTDETCEVDDSWWLLKRQDLDSGTFVWGCLQTQSSGEHAKETLEGKQWLHWDFEKHLQRFNLRVLLSFEVFPEPHGCR